MGHAPSVLPQLRTIPSASRPEKSVQPTRGASSPRPSMAMAVQARYPSQSFIGLQTDVADHQQQHHQISVPIGAPPPTNMVAGSGSTSSNISGARKRRRDEMCLQPEIGIGAVSPSIALQNVRSILLGEDGGSSKASVMSTSGRPASFSSFIDQQAFEIDAVIRREIEMRAALVEMATKRYRRMLLVLGQRFQTLLKEEESKLALALKRNQELEESLKQVAAETQLWIAQAKNNEAVVAALRASLEQVLHRSASATVDAPRVGFGDSPVCSPPVEDEGSSCYNGEEKATMNGSGVGGCGTCKSCGVAEACMLVLPCRHLCLCEHCECLVGQCPVCKSVKNAGVRVFLS